MLCPVQIEVLDASMSKKYLSNEERKALDSDQITLGATEVTRMKVQEHAQSDPLVATQISSIFLHQFHLNKKFLPRYCFNVHREPFHSSSTALTGRPLFVQNLSIIRKEEDIRREKKVSRFSFQLSDGKILDPAQKPGVWFP